MIESFILSVYCITRKCMYVYTYIYIYIHICIYSFCIIYFSEIALNMNIYFLNNKDILKSIDKDLFSKNMLVQAAGSQLTQAELLSAVWSRRRVGWRGQAQGRTNS